MIDDQHVIFAAALNDECVALVRRAFADSAERAIELTANELGRPLHDTELDILARALVEHFNQFIIPDLEAQSWPTFQ